VPLDPPIPTRTVAILRRAGGYHSAAASAFVRLTHELVADRGYAPPG
jgi:LysR family cyn operon transcriptional activator